MNRKRATTGPILAGALGATLLLAAAAPGPAGAGSNPPVEPDPEATDLVWPPPPQPARVRYLRSIATPEDVEGEKGVFGRVWEFVRGPQDEEMRKPMDVVTDDRGRIYVSDPAAKCVHVFDREEAEYERWETVDNVDLVLPFGLDTDEEGRLFVSDSEQRRVFQLERDGDLRRRYGGDELQRPTDLAVDPARGRLYVVDTPAHEIKVYGLRDGRLQRVLGGHGTRPGRFNFPSYVNVDPAGRLYVTDGLNGRIQVLSPEGEPLGAIGQHGDGSGDFSAPKGVGIDGDGHLYVADAAFDNIQVFDRKGRLLLYFGKAGQAPGRFWMPTGVHVDGRDRIYVTDSYNKRIQVFRYLGGEGGER